MIKAIETEYNGYRFRSRLEARWAVLFDAAEIKYQYETEGFVCDYEHIKTYTYLPDFYFPEFDVYGEVKGTDKLLLKDAEKISAAVDFEMSPVSKGLLLLGDIPFPNDLNDLAIYGNYLYWSKGVALGNFVICPTIDGAKIILRSIGLDYAGWPYIPEKSSVNVSFGCPIYCNGIKEAAFQARQARFEHGEHPATDRRHT